MTETAITQQDAGTAEGPTAKRRGGQNLGLAILRITLGVIILVTWFSNLDKDIYSGPGLEGIINWLFSEDGNNSSLGFYESLLDAVIVPIAELVSKVQLVVELGMGVGLILGLFTRFFSLTSVLFFTALFLGYFGGNEWIWTYVILASSALAVFLGYAGRSFGLDRLLARTRGESPFGLFW